MAENIREMNIVSPDVAVENHLSPSHYTVIEPSKRLFYLNLRGIWDYRELLLFLAWRDLKTRYAQTTIGFAWAIVQPVAMMLLFTLVFSNFAKLPSDGVPYPIFAYAALLPWGYFSRSLDKSSFSIVAESNLISKVYFPRIIVPISATLAGLVDFAIAFLLLLVMMVFLWGDAVMGGPLHAHVSTLDHADIAGGEPVAGGAVCSISRYCGCDAIGNAAMDLCLARRLSSDGCRNNGMSLSREGQR